MAESFSISSIFTNGLGSYGSVGRSTDSSAFHADDEAAIDQDNHSTNDSLSIAASISERLRNCRFSDLALGGAAALVTLAIVKAAIETVTGEEAEWLKKVVNYSSIALIVGVAIGYYAIHVHGARPALFNDARGADESAPALSSFESFPEYGSHRAHNHDTGHQIV